MNERSKKPTYIHGSKSKVSLRLQEPRWFAISFSPVYTGSEENQKFFSATPGGEIRLFVVNPEASAQFEVGKEYYIDFTNTEGD